ncbi:MAG TPA: hypothetical protein VGS08_00875 [Candidatus Saccharimonadales bacterium]|nr:hypothetical protein [Candidatus Saccharimonadales bacterium]
MPESLQQDPEQQFSPEHQYIEGPWKRISGDTPLSDWELKALGPTFDLAYGSGNWDAHSIAADERQRGGYAITVSPDAHNVYALTARRMDEQGPGDNTHIQLQQGLRNLAKAEGHLQPDELSPPRNDTDGLPPSPQRN